MAWASLNTLGSNSSKSASTSLTMSNSAGAEVGHIVIVLIGKDNTSTVDGDNGEVTSVTDGATPSNTYIKLREYTRGAAAGSSATISVWMSQITTHLSSSNGITANFA